MVNFGTNTAPPAFQGMPQLAAVCMAARYGVAIEMEFSLENVTTKPKRVIYGGVAYGFKPARAVTVEDALMEEGQKDSFYETENPSFAAARKASRRRNAEVLDKQNK